MSSFFDISDQAVPTHFVMKTLLWEAASFSLIQLTRFSSICCSNNPRIVTLNGLLKTTSNGWTRLVHTCGTLIKSVFFIRIHFTLSVCCAWCTSTIKIFQEEPLVWGLLKQSLHCWGILSNNLVRHSKSFFKMELAHIDSMHLASYFRFSNICREK